MRQFVRCGQFVLLVLYCVSVNILSLLCSEYLDCISILLLSIKMCLQGLLPRGEKPNPVREKHNEINKRLAEELEGAALTSFLKIDDKEFMSSEGIIRRSVMYDFLHLTAQEGYQKLCEPLLEEIQNLLGTFIKVESTVDTASLAGDLDHSPSN